MGNTNVKENCKAIANYWRNKLNDLNESLDKPFKLKTKFNYFESKLSYIIKGNMNHGYDYELFKKNFFDIAKSTDIPSEIIDMIKDEFFNTYNQSIKDLSIVINNDREIVIDRNGKFLSVPKYNKVVFDGEAEEEEIIPTSTKKKKNEVNFQDSFNKSFNKLVVKANPITSREELRSLVRLYYDIQNFRIGAGNRQYQLDKNEEDENETKKKPTTKPNVSFEYATAGLKETEETISKWIKEYVKNDPIGQWLISIKGIGPVLAGGLLSYIDISKCQTAGSIWRYAGWEGHRAPKKKGVKLDYNPNFRVLCWKCGESFQKVSGAIKDVEGNPVLDEHGNIQYRSLYGGLYAEKLKWYIEKNEAGGFADAAKLALSEKNITAAATKATYESGKLPMAHLISMAKRYAVKIFLSHLFTVWYEYENKKPAPRPFVEVHCGHVHIIEPPHKDILDL